MNECFAKEITFDDVKEWCESRNMVLLTREVFELWYYGFWIPSNAMLPDQEERVLCCTRTKKGMINILIGYHDGERWVSGMNSNVVAWMKLPQPYKGGKE